jgi:hypothetical protein
MSRLANVNWHGTLFRGKAYSKNEDGSWVMIAIDAHPRVAKGHKFLATPEEIIWDDEATAEHG